MKEIHLFDLPEELYVKLNEEFTINIFSKINENFCSLVKFASHSGIKEQILRDSKNRGILLSIRNLKIISRHIHINEFSLEKEVKAIKFKSGYIKNPNLPFRIDKNIGVITGALLGDGGISKRSGYEVHYTNKVHTQVDTFLSAVRETFGDVRLVTDKIDESVRTIKLSGVLGRILVKNFKIPLGNKVYQDYEIPECIMGGDNEIITFFLRRLFDDEGTVAKSNRLIALRSSIEKDKKYSLEPRRLVNLRHLISLFDIRSTLKRVKERSYFHKGKVIKVEDWTLNIHDRNSVQQYATNVNFDIGYKARILETVINSYKLWETPKNESIKFFLDSANQLVLENGNFTSKTLSKKSNRSIRRTNRVIKKMLEKGLIYQVDNRIRDRNFSITDRRGV